MERFDNTSSALAVASRGTAASTLSSPRVAINRTAGGSQIRRVCRHLSATNLLHTLTPRKLKRSTCKTAPSNVILSPRQKLSSRSPSRLPRRAPLCDDGTSDHSSFSSLVSDSVETKRASPKAKKPQRPRAPGDEYASPSRSKLSRRLNRHASCSASLMSPHLSPRRSPEKNKFARRSTADLMEIYDDIVGLQSEDSDLHGNASGW